MQLYSVSCCQTRLSWSYWRYSVERLTHLLYPELSLLFTHVPSSTALCTILVNNSPTMTPTTINITPAMVSAIPATFLLHMIRHRSVQLHLGVLAELNWKSKGLKFVAVIRNVLCAYWLGVITDVINDHSVSGQRAWWPRFLLLLTS